MIDKALVSLRPNAQWSLSGDDLAGLVWHDEKIARPTDAEILAEAERLEATTSYIDERRREYLKEGLTAEAMVVALWENDPSVLAEMESKRQAVKTRIPKPEK